MIAVGIALILLGLVYLRWPNVFRRWFWLRTSIAIRAMSEEGYRRYMRGLGVFLIVVGILLVAAGAFGWA